MKQSMLLLLGIALGSTVACGSRAQRTESFMTSMRTYNDGMRWQRWSHAASHIPSAERTAFLDERNELEKELRIDDWELLRLDYSGDRQSRAKARVRYTWHLDNEGLVHETTTVQRWQRHGKRWLLDDEIRSVGKKMPGVAEPPRRRAKRPNRAALRDDGPKTSRGREMP
jgi:hypothetical protein